MWLIGIVAFILSTIPIIFAIAVVVLPQKARRDALLRERGIR